MIKLETYKDPEGETLETHSVGDLLRIVQGWTKNHPNKSFFLKILKF